MLAIAFEKLYEWLPLPPTYIKAGSQLVAPLGSIIHPINYVVFCIYDVHLLCPLLKYCESISISS
ncbi:MAG: hypothetical protein K2M73_00685 [Lachnospiraceae bacterium]|nr:hypothetical protein [Lachnospiraceae bacterium]MDE6698893.1 hypothetical protein [Lachnospiraceae bacterium]